MAEPARFFTRARRIPILVGRLPDGRPMPGGPYTLVQVLSGAGVGLTLSKTTALWAHFGGLLDLVFAACVVVGVVWGTGKLPSSGRNPFTWVLDAVSLYSTPHQGSMRGRPLRVSRPRLVRHRLVVLQAPQPAADPAAVETPPATTEPHRAQVEVSAKPAAAVPAATGPALSGVARLLAGAVTREDSHA
ncbi:hypothetical protein [Cellulomonas marina]|uniref:TcpE family protein n=1 Tax=Cellulomonas marina TaxID=988821 RepID=A0A1I1AQ65_9CELL|nr:hypothetical protein [Cellulomonas marina]GIG29289.1 hypothetical protein Cma02nite_18890 [Cellulomonas marina]SFB40189.1 hypothetical protein SAMN05421867_12134 [Cellulomonas marina]